MIIIFALIVLLILVVNSRPESEESKRATEALIARTQRAYR